MSSHSISTDDGQTYDDEYSAVNACDGIRSSTRDLILDSADTKDCIKTRDMFIAYFSVPARPEHMCIHLGSYQGLRRVVDP